MQIVAVFVSIFCSCKDDANLDFTIQELALLGNYSVNDTIYFESNLGNLDTIIIRSIHEAKDEGGGYLISTKAYHSYNVEIKHLPQDHWGGSSWVIGGKTKKSYQHLISIGKSPPDPHANYHIHYRGFISRDDAMKKIPRKIILNKQAFSWCYKINHRYPERVVDSNDIEIVYWTAKYGLTAYSSKSGETWVVRK